MRRNKQIKGKLAPVFMAVSIAMAGISGCADKKTPETGQSTAGEQNQQTQEAGEQTSGSSTENGTKPKPLAGSTVDTEFTDRDKDSSYSEAEAIKITLNGNEIQADHQNVSVSGTTATISGSGTYLISGFLENGQIIIDAPDTDKIQIVLKNADIHCETSAACYIKKADKVFLTLDQGSENRLSGGAEYTAIDDNTIDGVLFSKEDLTINGSGSLNIEGNYKHGIVSKDTLAVTGGTLSIDSVSQCLSGKDGIKILDGTFQLTTEGKAVKAENTDDDALGNIYVAGGSFTVKSADDGFHASGSLLIDGGSFEVETGDDAFHADQDVVVNGGTLSITECREGLEGYRVTVNGGDISIKASDDGVNAASPKAAEETADQTGMPADQNIKGEMPDSGEMAAGQPGRGRGGQMGPGGSMENDSNAYIEITGGTLLADAGGDGLDSNGSLYISGGTIYVSGSEGGGDGALDYNGEGVITGGIVIAAGGSGMAQGFADSSSQYSILQNLSGNQEAESAVTLTSEDGTVLASWNPVKRYSSVVVSCPGLEQNGTYTLTAGTESTELVLESVVTSNGNSSPGAGRGAGGPGPRAGAEGRGGKKSQETVQ